MRPVLFVICFTIGVSLMVFSGYLPKTASAHGNGHEGLSATTGSSSPGGFRYRPRLPLDYEYDPVEEEPVPDETVVYDDVYTPDPNEDALDARYAPDDDVAEAAAMMAALGEALESDSAAPSDPNSPQTSPPVADAGVDRVTWIGWNEIVLDGSASQGTDLRYDWIQVSGSRDLTIKNPAAAQTVATGFELNRDLSWTPAVYEFELMVADATGRESYDTVRVVVQSAPDVRIAPRAERYFTTRDGYILGQYESWVTNLETYESVFEIVSLQELTFTKVGGSGVFELTGGKVDDAYVYRVVLYGSDEVTTTWVEYLVDTSDNVPGLMQFGVNWVEPYVP